MVTFDVEEFQKLSEQNVPRDEFCDRVLERLVEATGADTAVLWNCETSPFQPVCRHATDPHQPLRNSEGDHARMLARVISERKSVLLRPDSQRGPAPLILMAPLPVPSYEVIELVVPPASSIGSENELMSTLHRATQIASQQQPQDSESSTAIPVSMEAFSRYIEGIHKSLDKNTTSSHIANETRLLLDCDRVTVLLRNRGRFRIQSISGQPSVNRRSNMVRLLEKTANLVLNTGSDFWYPSDDNVPPALQTMLDDYLATSATRSLVVKPVHQRLDLVVEDPESNERPDNPVIGALIYEHCVEQWEREAVAPNLDFVTEHAGTALRNATRHSDLFLYPVWSLLSKSRVLTAPRVLPNTILVALVIAAAVLFLTLWQVPFYVSATGVLIPRDRVWVYAGNTGEINSVFVEHGSNVNEGQQLLKLKNRNLELQLADTHGRIEVLGEQLRDLENRKFRNQQVSNKESTAEENINSIKAEIKALTDKETILKDLLDRAVITSPMKGQVITWDVRQKLEGRTVRPEQQLLEIADLDGPWILELDVADRRAGHLLRGLKRSDARQLTVSYRLAADPNKTYQGKVSGVAHAIQFSENNEQIIRVFADIDVSELKVRQAKTGVTAKIYCGYDTSIGYLWLHDVAESFQRYISFYFVR